MLGDAERERVRKVIDQTTTSFGETDATYVEINLPGALSRMPKLKISVGVKPCPAKAAPWNDTLPPG